MRATVEVNELIEQLDNVSKGLWTYVDTDTYKFIIENYPEMVI